MPTDGLETELGQGARQFPTTLWSEVLAAGDLSNPLQGDRLDRLIRIYWRPVYAFIRTAGRHSIEDSKDLTQSFFLRLLRTGTLSRATPERGSFRAYLKQALRHHLIDVGRSTEARLPDTKLLSLDAPSEEFERLGPASSGDSPEKAYDREWTRDLLDAALKDLEQALTRQGKAEVFEILKAYAIDAKGQRYEDLAAARKMSVADVRNRLSLARQLLRGHLREKIRQYVERPEDVDAEFEELFGA